MYTAFFGLSENPFKMTPDQRFLFLSNQHIKALNHLRYGIKERKGFMVVSGGIGTGKTTLCRTLLNELDGSFKTAFIFNTALSDGELLETINEEFGIRTGEVPQTRKQHIDLLNRFLLNNFKQGNNAVLIIDEAQHLSKSVLEQLRMLSNLETEREKLIQIVLVGQPELAELLASPDLKQLDDRIVVRFFLKPLEREDVEGYLEHRLAVAGSRGGVSFTTGAVRAVYKYSRGNPRRINALCDRALLVAYCTEQFTIGRHIIRRAMDDIRGNFSPGTAGLEWLPKKLAPVAAVAVMAVILLNLWGGQRLGAGLSGLFSAVQTVATVQTGAFEQRTVQLNGMSRPGDNPFVRRPIEDQQLHNSVYLTDRASLAVLFRLFNVQEAENDLATGDVYPGVFSFNGSPEFYRLFGRPFRMRIKSPVDNTTQYLLVKRVTTGGAIVQDGKGHDRAVTEDFILKNWDGEISWVYPHQPVSDGLTKEMNGPAALKIQHMLKQIGYPVEPRGVLDTATREQIMRFQVDFGLPSDGLINRGTKALLYQISDLA